VEKTAMYLLEDRDDREVLYADYEVDGEDEDEVEKTADDASEDVEDEEEKKKVVEEGPELSTVDEDVM